MKGSELLETRSMHELFATWYPRPWATARRFVPRIRFCRSPRGCTASWISEDVEAIERCVDRVVCMAGVSPSDVDRVFLTGGSSFVPAVRGIFETRFGAERIRCGNEFTSVARGLALCAGHRISEN